MDVSKGTVEDLMRAPIIVQDTSTLEEILRKMVTEKRNSLTVVNANGEFVGAVNALDVIRAVLPDYLEGDAFAAKFADNSLLEKDVQKEKNTPVSEFMSKKLPTIKKDTSLVEATVQASKRGRGRITVIDDDNKPVGVMTRTEIKRVIASYLDPTMDSD